mgnify:CR=1 FL=1
MASKSKIRGITVEIGGDTTQLGKALDGVNKKSRELQSELNGVNKLLKLDPANVDLLRQKQTLLTQAIAETKQKLDILKESQEQVQQQFERGEITVEQYRDFQREIAATEQKLDKLTDSMKEFGSVAAQHIADAGGHIVDFGNKVKDVGGKLSATVTPAVTGAFVAITEGTRELRGDLARLEVNAEQAGRSIDDMSQYMTQIVGVTGEVDSSIEGLSNLLATGISPEGFSEVMDALSGAAIKFSDTLKFEGIADGLQETLATGAGTGAFGELLERSGIVLDDFNAGLEKAIENGTQENYILQTLADTGLSDFYAKFKEGNPDLVESAEASYKLQEELAKIGKLLDPLLAQITGFAATVLEKFNSLPPATQTLVLSIAGVAAAIGPVIMVIGAIISGFGNILTLAPEFASGLAAVKGAFAALNAVMAANPIGAVILALTAVGTALYALYQNCEGFRTGVDTVIKAVGGYFKDLAADASAAFADIKKLWTDSVENISTKWNNMCTTVTNGWNTTKESLSTSFRVLKETCVEAVNHIVSKWDEFKTSVTNKVTETVDKVVYQIASIPGKINYIVGEMAAIGKNLLEGLWNGVANTKDWLIGKIRGLGSSVLDAIREGFDTHSPSRETEAIGRNVSEGLGIGIEKGTDKAVAAAENTGEAVKDAFDQKAYETAKVIENSRKQLESKLKAFGTLFEHETDKDGKTLFKLGDLKNDIKQIEQYTKALETLKKNGLTESLFNAITEMDVSNALEYMENLLAMTESELTEYIKLYEDRAGLAEDAAKQFFNVDIDEMEAAKKVAEANAKMQEELERANKEALEKVEQAKTAMSDKLQEYGDLFTVEDKGDGVQIVNLTNLEDEIEKIEAYGNALEELKSRGATEGLLSEITDMNVDDAMMYMEELLDMSAARFDEYIGLYEEKMALAQEVAAQFYSADSQLIATTESMLSLESIGAGGEAVDETIAQTVGNIVQGATNNEYQVFNYAENLKNRLIARLNSYRLDWVNIGYRSMQWIAEGVRNGESLVVNAMCAAVYRAIRAAREAADMHSPSRETEKEIGKPLVEGVAVGIAKAAKEPADAMGEAVKGVIEKGTNVSRNIDATFGGTNNGVSTGDILNALTTYLPQLVTASSRQIVLDTGTLVGGTIDAIDRKLGQTAALQMRGV